jgi:hypothetical protein
MKDAGLSNSFPDNNSLIALALLVAESDPSKKKQMIDLIISLITE